LREGGWLSTQALLVIESAKGESFDAPGFTCLDIREYGDTEISFLTPAK